MLYATDVSKRKTPLGGKIMLRMPESVEEDFRIRCEAIGRWPHDVLRRAIDLITYKDAAWAKKQISQWFDEQLEIPTEVHSPEQAQAARVVGAELKRRLSRESGRSKAGAG